MFPVTAVRRSPLQARFARPLEPIDRVSEGLFGLIMALTVTCSISAATAGRQDVRTMLFGALGANLAWGVIDAIMYLMACFAERGQGIDTLRSLRRAADPQEGRQIIADALPPVVASVLQAADLERLRQQLAQLPEPPRPRLNKTDLMGALAVFLWVVLIALPVVIPFVLVQDARLALRLSNLVAVVLLFMAGYKLGQTAGGSAWATGVGMVVVGGALVAMTIALGG